MHLYSIKFYYRYLQHVPEPPAIDLGHCEAEGDLNVAHVHVAPGASSDVITIMFSTNVRTNSMLALQYGVDENMEYETFVSKAEVCPSVVRILYGQPS